jgi:hypothetical protein
MIISRPSRRALRALLRIRKIVDGRNGLAHPEEATNVAEGCTMSIPHRFKTWHSTASPNLAPFIWLDMIVA